MGAFFISPAVQGDTGGAAPPTDAEIRARFAEEGFAAPEVRETARWRLYVFPRIGAPARNLFDDADGDFCAVTGTVIYRGTTGEKALPLLLADLKRGGIERSEIFGQYALITGIGGALSLVTDPLGTYHVWYNTDRTAVSSSFLATVGATKPLNADPQSIYEYVFQGATYGDRTLFREIHLHACRRRIDFGETIEVSDHYPAMPTGVDPAPLAAHLERNLGSLNRYYAALKSAFGDNIDTALSGGYDSRLTLALLRAHGVKPTVHVYGRAGDSDVRIALAVAEAEGFFVEHVDKSVCGTLEPDAFAETMRRNLTAFHGHPPDGLFDNGTDLATRLDRCRGGRVALNGGGGEVFRNFFYLPDRSFTVRELLWSFYGAFNPDWCTAAFDEKVYLANKARKVKGVLGTDSDRLARSEVEAVYPLYRCRYWMGKNNSVNNRLGPALTPFIDANVVPGALALPLAYKNSGRFEARMIREVSPSLAAHLSDYGHDFSGEPPLGRRLRDLMVILRPPRLRRLSFRIKNRKPPDLPYWLTRPYVERVIDPEAPYMRQYFAIDHVRNAEHLNRIYTLEYLFQFAQPGAADPA